MRNLLLALIVLTSSVAFGAEVRVLETKVRTFDPAYSNAKFHMDTDTMEGFAKITVTEERWMPGQTWCDQWGRCRHERPIPMPRTVFSETVKIEGLMLVGEDIIFSGAEGDVNCGVLKPSRVFKVPTIYLNGNCSLESRLDRRDNLTVDFVTK